ncbi:MAG TPA: STAS domain-containing protein [Accumulibacter sp.]|uniref:STAS domain-containing protein n=1 Tax=Accumulibacter sp. TaxID=2053492 RepID=UPI0025E840BB|nr:STAS domain-containing protein [Accumulibacter sp.]MCM8598241.1 STAS domain-containing protein [Accumulibacter sp.]MCM8662508.1 STAS domain-containing protein [Accumulibacter sp.]HNC52541.1 STAS domain-containing protein [Accumulibacter sp.]HNO14318.1 STAS domain-containing protein [Accumulibacter sp.]
MIEQGDGGLRVIAPMIIANARRQLEAGQEVLRTHASAVEVDLSQVAEVDSSALSVLLAWLRTAGERGISLRIAHPPANLISLATLYGVVELLPLA